MKILGKKDGVVKLKGYIEGPGGQIPIEMFSSDNTVGRIAIARVSVPPQFAQQISDLATRDKYTVKIGEDDAGMYTVFTGYISGKFTRFFSGSIRTGLDLIHPARDLDQMRLMAPGLHCNSVSDFQYLNNSIQTASANAPSGFYPYFNGSGNIAKAILDGIVQRLTNIGSVTVKDPYFEGKRESLQPCIDLINSITIKNGECALGDLIKGKYNPVNIAINQRIEASYSSYTSVWDTLCMVFADFGMLMICNPDGTVSVSVDLAGLLPEKDNTIGGEQITLFDSSSAFYRNVKSVVLTSKHITCSPGISNPYMAHAGIVVSYPNPAPEGQDGATMSLIFPAWLDNIAIASTISYSDKEPITAGSSRTYQSNNKPSGNNVDEMFKKIKQIQVKYAKMIYAIESNKMRTFRVQTVMAPTATPGTNAYIVPWGNVIPFGESNAGLDMNIVFAGYCSTVQHLVDVQAKNISTTFVFRNVTSDINSLLDVNPLFSDGKSFTWE